MNAAVVVFAVSGICLLALMVALARRDRRGSARFADAHTRAAGTQSIHYARLHARAAADLESKRLRRR